MKTYKETTQRNGKEYVRIFHDMDGGTHYKWLKFSIDGKDYPVGSFDILRYEEIKWEHTEEIKGI